MRPVAWGGLLVLLGSPLTDAAWAADTTVGPPPDSYRPMQYALQETPGETLRAQPAFAGTPLYGTILLGDGEDAAFAVIVDLAPDWAAFRQAYATAQGKVEMASVPARIYVDANNDEDLTNDGDGLLAACTEDPRQPGQYTISTAADCQVSYADGVEIAYPIRFHMFPQRATAKGRDGSEIDFGRTLFFYRNAAFETRLVVGDTELRVRFVDQNSDGLITVEGGDRVVVDLNDDGVLDQNPAGPEWYALDEPFSLNGESYALTTYGPRGGDPTAAASDKKAQAPLYILPGTPAPDFTVPTLDGGTFTLSANRGHVVVLDFWATWCETCREEMPSVVAMWEDLQDDGFRIVGISVDRTKPEAPAADTVRKFAEANRMTWTQIVEDKPGGGDAASLYQIWTIPHTVLVGKDGNVIALDLMGAQLHEAARKALEQ